MTKSRKVRRESGRKYNKHYNPENGEYYEVHWDDWIDHRDGLRNLRKDKTLRINKRLRTKKVRRINYV
jgi:hypothetical protein